MKSGVEKAAFRTFTESPTPLTHSPPGVGRSVPHSAHSGPPEVGPSVPHSPHKMLYGQGGISGGVPQRPCSQERLFTQPTPRPGPRTAANDRAPTPLYISNMPTRVSLRRVGSLTKKMSHSSRTHVHRWLTIFFPAWRRADDTAGDRVGGVGRSVPHFAHSGPEKVGRSVGYSTAVQAWLTMNALAFPSIYSLP